MSAGLPKFELIEYLIIGRDGHFHIHIREVVIGWSSSQSLISISKLKVENLEPKSQEDQKYSMKSKQSKTKVIEQADNITSIIFSTAGALVVITV